MRTLATVALAIALMTPARSSQSAPLATWAADNGNGTYTNPIFYDEFSDPDMIRVADWFYLTGTTMHAMPGLPVLRSRDLVNWEFLSYAVHKLDLGPDYRLENGDRYGRGIWAPSFRYHDGTFYIFSNVNGRTVQIFTAKDPRGPWTQRAMKKSLHDLSVLFDDNGKVYAVWGYKGLRLAELTPDLTDIVEGTERQIIDREAGMGEGAHLYRFNGKYFIISAWWDGRMRMPAARADNIWGPWEVNPAISMDEDFGLAEGYREDESVKSPPFAIRPPDPTPRGRTSLHQGGIVQTPLGEWWGYSMMDYNSVGRLLGLSPVTWKDGWPYFGLPGNLGRTPRTWIKPKTITPQPIHAPYQRSDSFSGKELKPIWQWNHVPVDGQWSLKERPGYLRLKTLPADSFWMARNTLTQRAIGPQSRPTVMLDGKGLRDGDIAGLALLMQPYAWIGIEKSAAGLTISQFDQQSGKMSRTPTVSERIWLRADCDFMTEKARFSYSLDGHHFVPFGTEFTMVMQGRTFQGVRYSLFAYNSAGTPGGYADFDGIEIYEPYPRGLMRPIPYGGRVVLRSLLGGHDVSALNGRLSLGTPTPFQIIDMKLGRVALKSSQGFLAVDPKGEVLLTPSFHSKGGAFQWIETPTGELVLMSLVTNRFLGVDSSGLFRADRPGPSPDGKDGTRFAWIPQ
jgi:beta-xylosidase